HLSLASRDAFFLWAVVSVVRHSSMVARVVKRVTFSLEAATLNEGHKDARADNRTLARAGCSAGNRTASPTRFACQASRRMNRRVLCQEAQCTPFVTVPARKFAPLCICLPTFWTKLATPPCTWPVFRRG